MKMKKRMGLGLMIVLILGLVVGCSNGSQAVTENNQETISLKAVIDEVNGKELLVTVLDNDKLDEAMVNIEGFDNLGFVPEVGQTLTIVITSQIDMSSPPSVNPVDIQLVK